MPVRTANAQWNGNLFDGSGTVKLGSGAFEGPYSFKSRMEDGTGTNPEELVGAAHAGCYSMALSAGLSAAGHTPEYVKTSAKVTFDKVGDGFAITGIALDTEASIPGISDSEFQAAAKNAKENCPISKALTGAPITLNAKLVGA